MSLLSFRQSSLLQSKTSVVESKMSQLGPVLGPPRFASLGCSELLGCGAGEVSMGVLLASGARTMLRWVPYWGQLAGMLSTNPDPVRKAVGEWEWDWNGGEHSDHTL